VKQIVRLVADNSFGQIFITDTNPLRLNEILSEVQIDKKTFNVIDGVIEEQGA
jgi:DNA replication and repair protein RecF